MESVFLRTLFTLILVAGAAMAAQAQPRWAVSPDDIGPHLPPDGASLFETVVTGKGRLQDVPYPFERLVALVEKRAGCEPRRPCTRAVLIPLGRSLQRTAAAPEFFRYPRAVVAVVGESDKRDGLHLKDRLYLGYQEKADLIEVISYNEIAGRFEFQLVRDYRPGARPEVVYANRALCIACHQNQAPVFSRQTWQETNANPRIAEQLLAFGEHFHGIAVRQGVDFPNAIDESVARANSLAVTRGIWARGCGENRHCRDRLALAALQFRLTGRRGFDEAVQAFSSHVRTPQMQGMAREWPEGLAIPEAGIPNRDPLPMSHGARGLALAHVPMAMEALRPRGPRDIWRAGDPTLPRQMVALLAEWISNQDLAWLRARLANQRDVAIRDHAAQCTTASSRKRTRLRCNAERLSFSVLLNRKGAQLDWIRDVGNAPLQHYRMAVTRGPLVKLRPLSDELRLPDGNAIEQIVLSRNMTMAQIRVREDFSVFAQSFHVGAAVLSRPGLQAALGLSPDRPNALVRREDSPSHAPDTTSEHASFHRHCGGCHGSRDPAPPNFLAGNAEVVSKALKQCAPRIFARLSMGLLPEGMRDKTPMPPERLVHPDGMPSSLLNATTVKSLMAEISPLMSPPVIFPSDLQTLLQDGYETLPPCLPEVVP